jgi:Na+/proline symporter
MKPCVNSESRVSVFAPSAGDDALHERERARAAAAARDARDRRARLDAQAGLWLVGTLFVGLAIALLDRVGAPKALCAALATLAPALAAAGVGVASAAGRGAGFYFADRAAGAPYAALAWLAGLAAAAAALTLGAPARAPASAPAMLALAVLFAPLAGWMARASGGVSVADLVARRFGSALARRAAAIPSLTAGVLLITAGLSMSSGALTVGAGLPPGAALATAAAACALASLPGGLRSTTLAVAGAGVVALLGAAAAFFFARAWLAQEVGEAATPIFAQGGLIDIGLGLGASLAPNRYEPLAAAGGFGLALGWLIGPFGFAAAAGAPSPREARRAGFALWPLAIFFTFGALAFAALAAPPGAPDWAEATAATLDLFANVELSGAPLGFGAAAAASLGLALSMVGAHGVATAAGRDPLFDLRDGGALSSRQLGLARLIGLGAIVAAALALWLAALNDLAIEPMLALAQAAALSLAGLAPALATTRLPHAKGLDAAFATLAGLCVFVAASAFAPDTMRLAHYGVAALVGAAAGALTGWLSSAARRLSA